MIAHHAQLARALAEELELADDVLDALGASYEQWDGKGWPGELARRRHPAARRGIAQLAEFVEVAHRVGGVEAATRAGPHAHAASSSTRPSPRCSTPTPRRSSATSTTLRLLGRRDRRRAGARRRALRRASSTRRCAAIADFVDLKSPYTLGHSRAVADLAAGGGRAARLPDGERAHAAARRARARASGGSACRTRSGTSRGRSAPGSGSACGCTRT